MLESRAPSALPHSGEKIYLMNPGIVLATLIVFGSVVGTNSSFGIERAKRDCAPEFSKLSKRSFREAHLKKLLSLGYDRTVAERILLGEPEIAAKILKDPEGGAPVLLYRGLHVDFKKYDPEQIPPGAYNGKMTYTSNNADIGGGSIWVSPSSQVAEGYAKIPEKELDSVVIQFQVPKFMYVAGNTHQIPRGVLVKYSAVSRATTMRNEATFIRSMVIATEKGNKPRPRGSGFSNYTFVSPENVPKALEERNLSDRRLFEPRAIIEEESDPNWGTLVFK